MSGNKLNIIADTHSHTIASTHAYSTVMENASVAKERGLKAIAITDHGPAMPDAPHIWHFENLNNIARDIDGVKIIYGIETNIIDYNGGLDVSNDLLKSMDWVIASLHRPACEPSNIADVTNTYIEIAKNPYVDVIGHSGQECYKYDYEKVIPIFKEYGKLVEFNEGSTRVRKTSAKNCLEIAKLCKKYDVPVVVNSDAHFAYHIGDLTNTLKMLEEIDFPQKLIVNGDIQKLYRYILDKRGIDFNNI